MEIIVRGDGKSTFKPDQVILNIKFYIKSQAYQEVLDKGANSVNSFVSGTMQSFGFTKEDLKTRSYNIHKETVYSSTTKRHEFNGYSFNQNATLKFDYDVQKLSSMMEAISKLEDSPLYTINFGVKNEDSYRNSLLAKAYQDAEDKAKAIAAAAGKELRRCDKVDFKSFGTDYSSLSSLEGKTYKYLRSGSVDGIFAEESVADAIADTFTPEDVEVSETLYCLWIAE